jgi:hypothetical protein
MFLRKNRPAGDVVSALRSQIHNLDPALPLYEAGGLEEAVDSSFDSCRVAMFLLVAFCHSGSVSFRARHLWRAGLRRVTTNAGDRVRSAISVTRADCHTHPSTGVMERRHLRRARAGGRRGTQQFHNHPAPQRPADGPGRICGGVGGTGRTPGEPSASPPRIPDRSVSGLAGGVEFQDSANRPRTVSATTKPGRGRRKLPGNPDVRALVRAPVTAA